MSVPPMLEKSLPLSAQPGNVKKYKYLNGALFLFEAKTYYLIPHDVMAILHPTFDHVIHTILETNSRAEILFAAPKGLNIAYERLTSRIRKGLKTKSSKARLRFLPALTRTEFLSLVASVDIVLDPFPGSGTGHVYLSSLESLKIGTPVLTLDMLGNNDYAPTHNAVASMLRSIDRWSIAMKKIGIENDNKEDGDEYHYYDEEEGIAGTAFIANDVTEYINLALNFSKTYANAEKKSKVKKYFRAGSHIFYDDMALLNDFNKAIFKLANMAIDPDAITATTTTSSSSISLPEERMAYFYYKEHGHTIPKQKRKHRKRKK